MNNAVIESMHRLLLEEVDGDNAERFVNKVNASKNYPLDVAGQIQWISNFWVIEITKTGAMNALSWVEDFHGITNNNEFEAVTLTKLIPVIRELNLPRIN